MKSRRLLQSAAVLTLWIAWIPAANATEEFPLVLYQELGLATSPDCGLCHIKGNTGSGTAITPFALAMKDRGLKPEDSASLIDALDAMIRDGADSDGDGVPDIEELGAGTNPNSASPSATIDAGDDPAYGCAFSPTGNSAASLFLALLVAGAIPLRRYGHRKERGILP